MISETKLLEQIAYSYEQIKYCNQQMHTVGVVCKGCDTSCPNVGLSSTGFHWDCQLCKGCGKSRPNVGLSSTGFHWDCQPCKGCGIIRSGVGVPFEGYHLDCAPPGMKNRSLRFRRPK